MSITKLATKPTTNLKRQISQAREEAWRFSQNLVTALQQHGQPHDDDEQYGKYLLSTMLFSGQLSPEIADVLCEKVAQPIGWLTKKLQQVTTYQSVRPFLIALERRCHLSYLKSREGDQITFNFRNTYATGRLEYVDLEEQEFPIHVRYTAGRFPEMHRCHVHAVSFRDDV